MTERVECSSCALSGARLCRALRRLPCGPQNAVTGVRSYGPDEMLYEVGSTPGLIGILRSGHLRRERLLPDGRRAVLGLVFPGGVVGELPEWPAGYSLETATRAEICLFSVPVAKRLAVEDAEFRRGVAADLERQYSHELTIAWLRVGLRCRERVIAFLLMAADLRTSQLQSDGSMIVELPVGRRDWADLCNTTVESISRQMAELVSECLVEHLGGRRYRLRDLQALRDRTGLDRVGPPDGSAARMTAVNADRPVAVPTVSVRAPGLQGAARSQ